ncbi:tail fiber domain-containing protein [Sphingobium sp. BHU LFT2]|uniref:tail fiber domain-containing protein n=1 Tax=Sphingobium sp. BHU LFT2 TaxID=2807634 RepID=UPI001BE63181|nr:tail fiber domain-containing protein [Sphingobium sp. BHU LFT2]MBT2242693.1 tail fiber domain-containing protein [Sphingobium sp. BHU LFT2]
MAAEDQLAGLLARNASLFADYEAWSNGQNMVLAGRSDDPDSFDAAGGKAGPLGYYPVVNASGQTIYVPCMERLREIAEPGSATGIGVKALSSIDIAGLSSNNVPSFEATGSVEPGDGGEGLWVHVDAEPAHPGKRQDPRGGWLELRCRVCWPEQFATTAMTYVEAPYDEAAESAASDWSQAFIDMIAYARATKTPIRMREKMYRLHEHVLDFDDYFVMEGEGSLWYERGTIASALKVRGTVLLFTGTLPKTSYAYGVTDLRTSGGVLPNPDAVNAPLDSNFALTNFYNDDANVATGEGATPRAFSAAMHIKPNARRSILRNFTIMLGNKGVSGYDAKTPGWAASNGDVALYINGASDIIRQNVTIIGYWRMVGCLIRANGDPLEWPSGTIVSAERIRMSDCYDQGLVSTAIRGADHYVVTAVGANYVEIPWTPNHPFHRPGVLPGDVGSRIVSGEITIPSNGSFTIADLAKVGDKLRITLTSDPTAVITVNSLIQSAHFGAGCAGLEIRRHLMTGLFHQTGRRSTDPVNGLPMERFLEVSGARLRGWKVHGRWNGYAHAIQIHNSLDGELIGEAEGKGMPDGTSGFCVITSPARNNNSRVTYASPGSEKTTIRFSQALNVNLQPALARSTTAFPITAYLQADGLDMVDLDDKNYDSIVGKNGSIYSGQYGSFRQRLGSDGAVRIEMDLAKTGVWSQVFKYDGSTGYLLNQGLTVSRSTGALSPSMKSSDSFVRMDLISYRASSGSHAAFAGKSAYGTEAAPAVLANINTPIVTLSAYPFTGSDFAEQGTFGMYCTAAHVAGSNHGVYAAWDLTAPGTTSRIRAARLDAGGAGFQISGAVTPTVSNSWDLGSATYLWAVVRAATGTINTSDERLKQWRGGLTAAELRAGKRIIAELGFYQWIDAIAEKGEDGARYHFGVRAQTAFAILTDEGLDWRRYAWCCHDEWDALPEIREPVMATRPIEVERQVTLPMVVGQDEDGHDIIEHRQVPALVTEEEEYDTGETIVVQEARDAGDRYGVRPDQLALFLIAVNHARLEALEALSSGA